MRTVILCGGRGTRAYPRTAEVPKPLMEIADEPILAHLMRIYARQGLTDFLLSAGYLSEQIVEFADDTPDAWDVEVVDTGLDTRTGDRILHVRDHLGPRFLANYGDGLADIDLAGLRAFHDDHDGAATLTAVPLPSPYGTLSTTDEGRILDFHEKPVLPDRRINGGYFVFDEDVFGHWEGADLERDVLPKLAAAGELYAYQHDGFWGSLDTYKDALRLTEHARSPGGPPWSPDSP